MFSRAVPLMAIFAVIIVAIMSFFLWRSAEQDASPSQPPREAPLQRAEQARQYAQSAEQAALRAEAAAQRAEALLEALLLIEAKRTAPTADATGATAEGATATESATPVGAQ